MRHQKDGEDLEKMVNTMKIPKILTVDIETSPIIAYTWGPKYESNIIDFVENGKILSYSAKWLGGKQETKGLINYPGYKPGKIDDKKIVKDIHRLLDEADIVISQNGVDFDMKYINTRFVAHGLPPPSPYKVVDTKREAKKYLRLPSNSLDDICQYFNLGKKLEHKGFSLWLECIAGDKKSWKTMLEYNAHDVRLTEQVYLLLRPYMKTHTNLGMFAERPCCPNCGGNNQQARGYARTISSTYQRFQCVDCGAWSRSSTKEKGHAVNRGV